MLMKAIALDSQAVQRHRVTILECVKVRVKVQRKQTNVFPLLLLLLFFP